MNGKEVFSGALDPSGQVTIDGLDPALGDLLEISFQLTSYIEVGGTALLDPPPIGETGFYYSLDWSNLLRFADGSTSATLKRTYSGIAFVDGQAGATVDFDNVLPHDLDGSFDIGSYLNPQRTPELFTQFAKAGAVSFALEQLPAVTLTSFNLSILDSHAAATRSRLSITYFYDDGLPTGVPEPATWAMMIGGFGLIGGMLRRRQLAFSRT